jgi:hypothetical protein
VDDSSERKKVVHLPTTLYLHRHYKPRPYEVIQDSHTDEVFGSLRSSCSLPYAHTHHVRSGRSERSHRVIWWRVREGSLERRRGLTHRSWQMNGVIRVKERIRKCRRAWRIWTQRCVSNSHFRKTELGYLTKQVIGVGNEGAIDQYGKCSEGILRCPE